MTASLTYVDAQSQVLGRLRTKWAAAGYSASIPIVWQDKNDSGDDAPKPPADGSAYVEATIHFGDRDDAAMGDQQRKYTCSGVLVMNLYTPHGDGLRLALQARQVFAEGMSGPSTARGVHFRGTSATDMGKYGNYQRTRMTARFEFDQVS